MDFPAVMQGLADAASAIEGLNCYATLPGSIVPPTFAPYEVETVQYNQTFKSDSMTWLTLTCAVFVSNGYTEEGAKLLTGYLTPSGPTSIKAALEADRTLGGAALTLNVDRARGAFRLYTVGNIDYLCSLFDVRVYA